MILRLTHAAVEAEVAALSAQTYAQLALLHCLRISRVVGLYFADLRPQRLVLQLYERLALAQASEHLDKSTIVSNKCLSRTGHGSLSLFFESTCLVVFGSFPHQITPVAYHPDKASRLHILAAATTKSVLNLS